MGRGPYGPGGLVLAHVLNLMSSVIRTLDSLSPFPEAMDELVGDCPASHLF